MSKYLAFAFAMLAACDYNIQPPINHIENSPPIVAVVDMPVDDAGTNNIVIPGDTIDALPYYACQSSFKSDTNYARLSAFNCTDSVGKSYIVKYWDSDLQIFCKWKTASDSLMRCLPVEEQSSLLYSDDNCSSGIVLTGSISQTLPDSKYIGIRNSIANNINVYMIGTVWDGPIYYSFVLDAGTLCNMTYIQFPNAKMFRIGDSVSPDIFVSQ